MTATSHLEDFLQSFKMVMDFLWFRSIVKQKLAKQSVHFFSLPQFLTFFTAFLQHEHIHEFQLLHEGVSEVNERSCKRSKQASIAK